MKRVLISLVATLGIATQADAALVYQLDAGSSIRLPSTGETYELTGGFTWDEADQQGSLAVFNVLALSIQGGPASIVLNASPIRTATSVFQESDPNRCGGGICDTFFNAPVDLFLSGQVFSELGFGNIGAGSYEGSFLEPTRLSYTSLVLVPESGGSPLAWLNFSATLVPTAVPVPGSLALMLPTLLGMAISRRRRVPA